MSFLTRQMYSIVVSQLTIVVSLADMLLLINLQLASLQILQR